MVSPSFIPSSSPSSTFLLTSPLGILLVVHFEIALHVCVCEQSRSTTALRGRHRPSPIHDLYGPFNKRKPLPRRNHSFDPDICQQQQAIARQKRTLLQLRLAPITQLCLAEPAPSQSLGVSSIVTLISTPRVPNLSSPVQDTTHLRTFGTTQSWRMTRETQNQRW